MSNQNTQAASGQDNGETRRDFLLYATTALGAVGVGLAAWPFVHSMNPAADVLALATIEVDLSAIEVGQSITVMWRKKPVFIRRRTVQEIEMAQAADSELGAMRDPQKDEERVQKPEWLVLVGICTHLGCVPQGQRPGEERGEFGGWFCSCHGSQYDTAGRIRKGPAPKNLEVPDYAFLDDTTIRIG